MKFNIVALAFVASLKLAVLAIEEKCLLSDERISHGEAKRLSCDRFAGADPNFTLELCEDDHSECREWSNRNRCLQDPVFMLKKCRKSCRICNNVSDEGRLIANYYGEAQAASQVYVKEYIKGIDKYMFEEVMIDKKYETVRSECKNRHRNCSFWAANGECTKNPRFMKINCAPACYSCDLLDYKVRCPIDPEGTGSIWGPGDLNQSFERLISDPQYLRYEPKILSRPDRDSPSPTQRQPWILELGTFLTSEECEHLIILGEKKGYRRSKDVGDQGFDGNYESRENPARTSSTAWCSGECAIDPVVQRIEAKIQHVTGIPTNHSEYLQLLKYDVGQRYGRHHDYIAFNYDRPQGVRVLTLFMYLNTVPLGGGTKFNQLDLTVEAVQGKAILWPSVLDDNPHQKDPLTDHEALFVQEGIKYGANAWIHQRDFRTPFQEGCA